MDAKLDSLQTVIIVLTCLVPGFILYSTSSLFTVRRSETKELLFLRFVTFTALNFIACLIWVRLILASNFIQEHPWRTIQYLIWINFGCPVVLGLLVAWIDHWQLPRKLAKLIGLQPMHSSPTAWDYCFSHLAHRGPRFVIVTLKDGKQIGGLFAYPAVASSDSSDRDIYLVDTHYLDTDEVGNKKWVSQLQNDGILIVGGEVRSFEFLSPSKLPISKPRRFFDRSRYAVKIFRQESEIRIPAVRWSGDIARKARLHIVKIGDKHRNFVSEIDKRLEEEKDGSRRA